MRRGATAEIDLDAVSHNLNVVRKIVGDRPVISVVKADAYGHGAREISRRLLREGAAALAVAYADEAVTLREAGIDSAILVLFDKQDIPLFFEYHLTPVIHDIAAARKFSEEAKGRRRSLDIHVKVDTGMGRLGLNGEKVFDDVMTIAGMEGLNVAGVMSHFSNADSDDPSFSETQLGKFVALREKLPGALRKNILFHIANSAAILSFPEAHLDAVRPGLMLYGYSPFGSCASVSSPAKSGPDSLRPAMRAATRILSLRRLSKGQPVSYGGTFVTKRESLLAVLPVGYADGYSRALSNAAHVLIRGRRAPVAGRVCMDLTIVDVTEIEGVAEGDEAVLLGRQGEEEITAHEIAEKTGTISYEVLTHIGSRSRRVYTGAEGPET